MIKHTRALIVSLCLAAVMSPVYSADEGGGVGQMRSQFTIEDLSDAEMQVLRRFNYVPDDGPVEGVDKASILAAKCYYALEITDVAMRGGQLLISAPEQGRKFNTEFYRKLSEMKVPEDLPAPSETGEKDIKVAPVFDRDGYLLYMLIGYYLGDAVKMQLGVKIYRYNAIEFNRDGNFTGSIIIF